MFQKSILSMLVILILGGIAFAFAQDDVEGSKDHPMISRYEDSYIIGYDQEGYDQLVLPAGPYEGGDTKTVAPEGKVTRILYAGPRGRSSIEVQRNYHLALQDAGFEILYECSENCQRLPDFFYGEGQKLEDRGDLSRYSILYDRSQDQRYLLARFRGPEGIMYASVFTVLCTGNYYPKEVKKEIQNRPVTLLQIVEGTAMETGKVQINADEMAATLNKTGKVSLYGIHFDTDKAIIKPESESTLAEIANLLKEHTDLTIGVVGHTDATGSLEHNMELSRQRAKAVVKYLTSKHNIAGDRLKPHGVGYLAPVATNDTPEGRSRNRRVELIKIYEE